MRLDRVIAFRNDRTVYRNGASCMKVFAPGYPFSCVLAEARYQTLAYEAGLPVPPVREVSQQQGQGVLVTACARGLPMDRILRRQPHRAEALIARLVHCQRQVHACRVAVGQLPRLTDWLAQTIKEAALSAEGRRALTARLAWLSRGAAETFCHGDMEPSNLVLGQDGSVALLDWADAMYADPAADAALTCLALQQSAPGALPLYLPLFSGEAGIPISRIRLWLPLMALWRARSAGASERARLYPLYADMADAPSACLYSNPKETSRS